METEVVERGQDFSSFGPFEARGEGNFISLKKPSWAMPRNETKKMTFFAERRSITWKNVAYLYIKGTLPMDLSHT